MGRGKRGGASIGVESQKEQKGRRWRAKRDRGAKGQEGRRVKRSGGTRWMESQEGGPTQSGEGAGADGEGPKGRQGTKRGNEVPR